MSVMLASGLITSTLLADILLIFVTTFLIWNYVRPIVKLRQLSNKLESKIGPNKKHWFFGHLRMFPPSEEGLLKRAQRTISSPAWVVNWFGPLLAEATSHHAETAITLLSSSASKNEHLYKFLRPWLGDGLLVSNGKKWQRNRHLLTPAFHFNILKPYAQVSNDCAKTMITKWTKKTGVAFDIYTDVNQMTLDTMLQCAMSFKIERQNEKEKNIYLQAVRDLTNLTMERITRPLLHIEPIFWLSSTGRKYKEALEIVQGQTNRVIQERRAELKTSKEVHESVEGLDQVKVTRKGKYIDFLDILLQTKDEDGVGLSMQEIRDEVETFLNEGHETTAIGSSWTIYMLAMNPECQKKCREELSDVIKDKEDIEWSDLKKLQYLTMCVKETLRLRPPVPAISRLLDQPLTFKSKTHQVPETTLEKGSIAGVNIFALHRNVHVWEDPEVFDPERFNPENTEQRSPHAFLPFSAGSRNCIGRNFAMNEIKIAVGQVLRKFEFYIDDETPATKMATSMVLRAKDGIMLKLRAI